VRTSDGLAAVAHRYGFDLLVVLAALLSALEVVLRGEAGLESGTSLWFGAVAMAVVVLPLLGRRRFPFAAPFTVWVLAAALSFVDGQLIPSTAAGSVVGITAAFLLGNLRAPVQRWLGLAAVVGGATAIVFNAPNRGTGDLVFVPVLFVIGWILGFALRERSVQTDAAEQRAASAEREREAVARIVVAEERARIGRELHDIVAHAVSVMVLQVGAVRHQLPPELADERAALTGVERAGRTALTEMRRLLGAMRNDDEAVALAPHPGLDDLEDLLDEVRRAGLPVQLEVVGERIALPPAVDLAAYRIIQEGLTNALKHAHATRADLQLSFRPDELAIEVHDDGRGAVVGDGLGHGLIGVRERVSIHGGQMRAGVAAEGGYTLATSLPLDGWGR
jgi:signal transduction histidine kinase